MREVVGGLFDGDVVLAWRLARTLKVVSAVASVNIDDTKLGVGDVDVSVCVCVCVCVCICVVDMM